MQRVMQPAAALSRTKTGLNTIWLNYDAKVLSNRPNSTPASFGSTGSRGTFLKGPNTPGMG